MQIDRNAIAGKIDELKKQEDQLIADLAKLHQIADAERLLEVLIKRAALKHVLDDSYFLI